MEAREVLEQVKAGSISIEEAEKYFRKQPFEELGYAKLDTHREIRSGFPEVVFCSGKPDEYLAAIYQKLFEKNGEVFGTRADGHQFELVKAVLPQVSYDRTSRILKIEKPDKNQIREDCSLYGGDGGYTSGRGGSPDGRVFRLLCGADL